MAVKKAAQDLLSLKWDNFSGGGGSFNKEGWYEIVKASTFTGVLPNQTGDFEGTYVKLDMQFRGTGKTAGDADGEAQDFYFLVFGSEYFLADDAGKGFVLGPKATKGTLPLDSNFGLFYKSLLDAGFDGETVENDVTVFEGAVIHCVPQPLPERASKNKDAAAAVGGKEAPKKARTQLFVDQYDPNGVKKTGGKVATTAPATAKKTAEPEAGADEADANQDDLAKVAMSEVLADKTFAKGGKKAMMRVKLIGHVKNDAALLAYIKEQMNDTAWLENQLAEIGWVLDGDTVVKA
jgi:hypothetical protein